MAYDKIWGELSPGDRKVVEAMIEIESTENSELIKVEKIREKVKMNSDVFTKYRERLIYSGVVDGSQYGMLKFKLPRFEEYVKNIR